MDFYGNNIIILIIIKLTTPTGAFDSQGNINDKTEQNNFHPNWPEAKYLSIY